MPGRTPKPRGTGADGLEREARHERLKDPGWTPGRRDVPALLALLREDRATRRAALSALERMDSNVTDRVLAFVQQSDAPGLALEALGRAQNRHACPGVVATLHRGLTHDDPRTRKSAARALGRLHENAAREAEHDRVEALLAALAGENDASVHRAIIEALGKTGDARAREAVRRSRDGASDRATVAVGRRAAMRLARVPNSDRETEGGDEEGAGPREESLALGLDHAAKLAARAPGPVWFRTLAGAECLLADRLRAMGAKTKPLVGTGIVEIAELQFDASRVRCASSVGFALPLASATSSAVAAALTSARGLALCASELASSFRLAWPSGKRRSATYEVAERVLEHGWRNAPTGPGWDAIVSDAPLRLELRPRLHDARFAYRTEAVAAASRPAVAALLVELLGPARGERILDPFAGSGVELCEVHAACKEARLFGIDQDPTALERAATNLRGAAAEADLRRGNALEQAYDRLDGIVTNPPFGRRVRLEQPLPSFLEAFLRRIADTGDQGLRVTWLTPLPRRTTPLATHLGFEIERRLPVSIAGFDAELQRLRLTARKAAPPGSGARGTSTSQRRSTRSGTR